jgi:two-component system, sensor histidine kinase and response regulator
LQEQNEALNAFAYTVAHDLQTSLAVLIGLSDALAEDHSALSEAEIQRHLVSIARQGEKMSSIIREILLLASMRKEEVVTEPLDMAPIVEAALQRLEYIIQESQAEILRPDKYPQALGYGPWVEEVWLNCLSNAIKYGGRPPCVEIGSTTQNNGYVKFWVRDNGSGLTLAEQALFFKSDQHQTRRRIKGHGLGLAIVQQIIRKLDGQVAVESDKSKGSVFSFSLLKDPTK